MLIRTRAAIRLAELMAGMPTLPLTSDCKIRFAAVDPLTGADVSGVTVARAIVYAVELDDSPGGVAVSSGPYMLVPGPTPLAPAGSVKVKKQGGQ